MFRNPDFFKALSTIIRKEYTDSASLRIWHPGCSNGQEVFSLAILLHELGLLEKSLLYGTEINHTALKSAQNGTIDASMLRHFNEAYRKSGGKLSLREYFNLSYDKAILNRNLRNNMQFGYHQLENDNSFQEFDIICCRNLFIYYDATVQTQMLQKMTDSLKPNGILCLGVQESISHLPLSDQYETINEDLTIYRKIAR
jgi:chemotaxis protein methyltransferase CheR